MKIDLKYVDDKAFETVNDSGNVLKMDMKDGGEKEYQSPTQLLLSATVGCAAVDIVSMIKKKRKTFVDLRAEATGRRRDEHPRKFVEIHIKYILTSPDTTAEELDKVVSLAVEKYCSVASSLDADLKLTHSSEVENG
ncbi:MAG: OsmC family protein [Bacteroidota bacterium]